MVGVACTNRGGGGGGGSRDDDDDDDAGDDAVDDDDATTVIASGSYLIEYDWGRAWNQAGAGDGFPYQWRESIDMNWFEI
jgi:hypothetical protein